MFYSSTLSISITVFQEFPYQSLDTDQNDINVEMDPTSAIEKGDLIKASGMVVVGWYHSHPTSRAYPSLIGTQNQRNYQRLFRDNDKQDTHTPNPNALMPFIGAIVSPTVLHATLLSATSTGSTKVVQVKIVRTPSYLISTWKRVLTYLKMKRTAW